MARARFLRPEFFHDEKIGELPFGARLLFAAIWCHSDLRGVFEHSAKLLRTQAFPYDEGVTGVQVAEWLTLLGTKGLVVNFEVDGKAWGTVVNWTKHQHISKKEQESGSKRPAPPRKSVKPISGPTQDHTGTIPEQCQSASPTPTVSVSPTATPTAAAAEGECASETPPPPSKPSGRENVKAWLARYGLPNGPGNVDEWYGGMVKVADVTSPEEAQAFLEWVHGAARRDNHVIEYWRHARHYGGIWRTQKPVEFLSPKKATA